MPKKIPAYLEIEYYYRRNILEGKYKYGDIIPSENDIAKKYNVSRMTVRKALNNLLQDGLIYRHKGKGTFVTFDKFERGKSLYIVESEFINIDGPVDSLVLSFNTIIADESLASRMQLASGSPVYYVERVLKHLDTVLVYEELYLPCNMYPQLTIENFPKSVNKFVEEVLYWRIKNNILEIEAHGLDSRLAKVFYQNIGNPILYIKTISFLDNGRVFKYSIKYYNAKHYRFKYNIPKY